MNLVFLDTVGLIGLWDQSDQWHASASSAYAILEEQPFIALTSPFVLLECANAASRRPYRDQLIELRKKLAAENMVISTTAEELATAWLQYESGSHGTASMVDITSFIIMRRLGITDAFTNDRHFKVAGFHALF